MTPFLKDLLLISNPEIISLTSFLQQSALKFLLPCFFMAVIVEYFGAWDFKGVVKRTIIAVLAIKLLVPLHVQFVQSSLVVSSNLLQKYSPRNKFLSAYREVKINKEKSVWKKLTSIVEMIVTDPIVLVIFLLSYFSFFLLTQLYSLVYYLAIAFVGLCSLLSIFSFTKNSLRGAIKTSLWCVLMPFVVTIVLCLIGDSEAFLRSYSGGIVQNLESLIQLLLMSIILLMTPIITGKIMGEAGLTSFAENLSQTAAISSLMTGLGAGVGLMSQGLSRASEVAKGTAQKSLKSGINQLAMKSQMGSEDKSAKGQLLGRITTSLDQKVNRAEHSLAKKAYEADQRFLDSKEEKLDFLTYRQEAQAFIGQNPKMKHDLEGFQQFQRSRSKASENLMMNNDGFVFRSKDWNRLPEERRKNISSHFDLDEKRAQENFIYFPKGSSRPALPVHVYQRLGKPKTISEVRNEKAFFKI